MRLTILLLLAAVALGQNASPPQQSEAPAASTAHQNGDGVGITGSVDILSDTQGVDFGPYMKQVVETVRKNWFKAIPESARMKHGKVIIEFAIAKDGTVRGMKLVPSSGEIAGLNIAPSSSGDATLDRAAWSGIQSSNPFPALPSEFTGSYLALRFRFNYNPEKNELDQSTTKSVH
jgi:outer membrane biosynthesis protein TonB